LHKPQHAQEINFAFQKLQETAVAGSSDDHQMSTAQ